MKVSFKKAFVNDGYLFFFSIALGVLLGFIFYEHFWGDQKLSLYIVFGSLFVLALSFIIYRFLYIKKVFKKGVVVAGKIKLITLIKDRGRLHFEFNYKDQVVVTSQPIMKTKEILNMKVYDEIDVVVNEKQLVKSFIETLYV